MSQGIPTLFEWAGGTEALNRLTQTFYGKVFRDPIVGLVFKNMSPDTPPMSRPSSARSFADRKPTARSMAATARWSCITSAST